MVAPARERGLKLKHQHKPAELRQVAPARERGLKYDYHEDFVLMYLSLPQGSVD